MYPMPTTPGYVSTGTETAGKIVGSGLYGYNYCQFTMLAYLSNAFLVYRGAVNWSFNPLVSDQPLPELKVFRNNISGVAASYGTVNNQHASYSNAARDLVNYTFAGTAGQAITNCATQSGLNCAMPMMSGHKYHYTTPANANQGIVEDGSIGDLVQFVALKIDNVNEPVAIVHVREYVSIGTDFSLHFFLNVPTLWIYSSNPVAL
jgi:hypothetical protein